jgi:ribonuclease-3
MKEIEDKISGLEKAIGIEFKDKKLIASALCHSSFVNESEVKIHSYERLEFLGDSVLSLSVSEAIYKKYPRLTEGELSKLRAALVSEDALCKFAEKINLYEYILFGAGEKKQGSRGKHSIVADVFESVIAAIYLDFGLETAASYIKRFLPEDPASELMIDSGVKFDYKTRLQEIIQKNPEEQIEYVILSEDGPAHMKTFTAAVMLNSNMLSKGTGNTKKQACQEAAKAALNLMGIK